MKSTKAFTLIETLIAISILMLVSAGVIFSVGNSLQSVASSDSRLEAEFIAQEGVEIMRAIRNANVLNKKPFYTNITSQEISGSAMCQVGVGCYADAYSVAIPMPISCGGACPGIKKSRFGYGYESGSEATKYTRTIEASVIRYDVSNQDDTPYPAEVLVVSKVTFTQKGKPIAVTSKSIFTNWYE